MLSKIKLKAIVGYLRYKQKLRDLNFKKDKVVKRNKLELKIAENLKKSLHIKERTLEKNVQISKFRLTSYKLEAESELAELDEKIKILSEKLEFEKDQDEREVFKYVLDKILKDKSKLEKEVDNGLHQLNKEFKTLEFNYKTVQEYIKVCDS